MRDLFRTPVTNVMRNITSAQNSLPSKEYTKVVIRLSWSCYKVGHVIGTQNDEFLVVLLVTWRGKTGELSWSCRWSLFSG